MFHSCMRRIYPLPDQLPGKHTSDLAAVFSMSTTLFLHSSYHSYIQYLQLNLNQVEKYGGWACSDSPDMFFYVHKSKRHDSTRTSLFMSYEHSCHPDSIMQAADGRLFLPQVKVAAVSRSWGGGGKHRSTCWFCRRKHALGNCMCLLLMYRCMFNHG